MHEKQQRFVIVVAVVFCMSNWSITCMLHSSKLRDKSEGSEYGERHSSILSIQINNHGSFVAARKKKTNCIGNLYWNAFFLDTVNNYDLEDWKFFK